MVNHVRFTPYSLTYFMYYIYSFIMTYSFIHSKNTQEYVRYIKRIVAEKDIYIILSTIVYCYSIKLLSGFKITSNTLKNLIMLYIMILK